MPGPSSSTVSGAVGEPDRDGAVRRAPLGGVVEQVGDRPLQRAAARRPPTTGCVAHVEGDARRAPPDPGDGPVDDLGQVDGLHDVGQRLVAGQLDEVADQRGQLLDLRADVVQQLRAGLRAAGPPAPSAWASRSRLVRSEVSGVRSSCPASATSWRCRSREADERGEHLVERRGEPGDLVVALDRQRGEVLGAGDVLDRGGQPAHRPQPVAGDRPAGHAPPRSRRRAPKSSITTPSLAQHPLLGVERLRDDQRAGRRRGGTATTR